MSKKSRAAAAQPRAEMTMTTSDIPVGGKPQQVPTERPPADAMKWNSEGTEVPPDDNGEVVGAPVPHNNDPDKDARIRKLLHGDAEEAEGVKATDTPEVTILTDKAEETEPEEGETATEQEKPAADAEAKAEQPKPKTVTPRRNILDNLATERAKRSLETRLQEANQQKNAAEARSKVLEETLNSKSIASLAKRLGLTREQAMEQLVYAEEETDDTTAVAAPAAEAAKAAADPEKEELKRRLEALERTNRQATDAQAIAVTQGVLAPMDLPLVKAARRIPVPQADGTVVMMQKEQVILAIAEQRWIAEGRPMHVDRRDYLAPAAETLEEALAEEHGPMLEAHAARSGKGGSQTQAAAQGESKPNGSAKSVPALGKRMAPGPSAPAGEKLPLDPDERRRAVKARFGWASPND